MATLSQIFSEQELNKFPLAKGVTKVPVYRLSTNVLAEIGNEMVEKCLTPEVSANNAIKLIFHRMYKKGISIL